MSEQTRITAIYGGAFDPIHFGHIKTALHVLAQPEIAQLHLLPCYRHPNKSKAYATPEHRYNMLKLIAKDTLIVDHRELKREGISYTVDTVKSMREELGAKVPLALVLGADAYAEINDWHNASQLPVLLHLIVLARPDIQFDNSNRSWLASNSLQEMTSRSAGLVYFMSNPLIDISSSRIRSMIAQGMQPRYLLPGVIWNYIRRNRLYDCKERL